MMGVDCAEIELLMKSKRKEKAAQDREAAWQRKLEEEKTAGQPSTSSDGAPTEQISESPAENIQEMADAEPAQ